MEELSSLHDRVHRITACLDKHHRSVEDLMLCHRKRMHESCSNEMDRIATLAVLRRGQHGKELVEAEYRKNVLAQNDLGSRIETLKIRQRDAIDKATALVESLPAQDVRTEAQLSCSIGRDETSCDLGLPELHDAFVVALHKQSKRKLLRKFAAL